ncbi:TRAP dicarboxylate transporter- DctM subunit [Haladaptatus paucihalophilus DX253]|uniref:TRAP dicarboxylate transporter-DctM subunit n=1 Tax=Haladaptatus paucihalophilus DX253 TaxID=797209 RepID=E7QMJ5_HALPU|nr:MULTISPECIES: TRAP transporter large permease [Haladaptatus]EFW94179.1 TRAP dicarboxylate transporter- DctM subunit [Haladaptatus paucihalophilus DX253]GKZ15201.1 ABC transporter permease [Haladaptatus sp. T7]SHL32693.1 TRAP transporter, DctM subunit [Haladaptatus paucihalophilus DX253]
MPEILLLVAFIAILMALYAVGVPAAYSLGLTVLLIMLLPIGPPLNLVVITQRFWAGMTSWVLLAVPFFLMAGRIMNITGITDDMFNFATELVGPLPGGLAQVNVFVSLVFSGMSGSAVADAAGIGSVEYEAMTSNGYEGDDAVGITGASAIIGPIIPPSIPVVVYAVLAQRSIGTLFVAGIVPGLLMALAMATTAFYLAKRDGWPREDSHDLSNLFESFLRALPGLITPLIIVGGILGGVFTATEAALIAVVYAILLGVFYYRSIGLTDLIEVSKDTFEDTASIVVIFGFANLYAYWLTLAGIPDLIGQILVGISASPPVTMLILTAILLVLGTFMEGTAVLLIMVPMLVPLYPTLGINPVQFGIVMVVALMYGLITPPFGLILFVLERVTDESLDDVMRSMIPYYLPLAFVLLLIILVPPLTLAVPRAFGLF